MKKKVALVVVALLLGALLALPLIGSDRIRKYDFVGELSKKEKVSAMTGTVHIASPGHPEMIVALDSVQIRDVTEQEAANVVGAALTPSQWVRNGSFFESKQTWTPGQPYADTISVQQLESGVMIQKIRRFKPLERQLLGIEHLIQRL